MYRYKNGQLIIHDERIVSHDAKGGVYQLLIKNSKNDDAGTYTCKAINDIGECECTALVVVEMAPQFVKKLDKLEAVESCDAEWNFQLIGLPKPEITFNKNNKPVTVSDTDEFYNLKELGENNYALYFKSVRPDDVGSWTCQASNNAGTVSCIGKLETLPLTEPAFVKGLSDRNIQIDVDNKIEIKVSGIPVPQIEWFKDDIKLTQGQ